MAIGCCQWEAATQVSFTHAFIRTAPEVCGFATNWPEPRPIGSVGEKPVVGFAGWMRPD